MKKLLVFVVLVFGASLALPSDGSSTLAYINGNAISRQECISLVANYMAQIDIRGDTYDRVVYARRYYDTNKYLGDLTNYYPHGCNYLHEQVKSIETNVPCYYNKTLMGLDETQNVKDTIQAHPRVRVVLEAEYACFYYNAAGSVMRRDGLYEAITNRQWSPELEFM